MRKPGIKAGTNVYTWIPGYRFRDSSAQNHFGPGLLGPDVSAHFSFRDYSAQFSGTARPIFYFFFYFFFRRGGGGLQFIVLFSICARQNKIQDILFNVILIFRQDEPCHEKICLRNFETPRKIQNSCTLDNVFRMFHQFQQCFYC